MAVDLTLMPLMSRDFWASHQLIDLERRRELWPAIAALKAINVPGAVSCYVARLENGERGYGDLEVDRYGSRLQWVRAGDLLTLNDHEAVRDNWQNRAVWSWLKEVPDDWPIVLYWH